MMRGLIEVVLEVGDLDRSAAFYRDLLGLHEVERWREPRCHVEGPVEFWGGKRSLFVADPDANVVELGDWNVDWARERIVD